MISIQFDKGKLAASIDGLKNFSPQLKDALFKAVTTSVINVQTTAKHVGYAPKDTGTLSRSITHVVTNGTDGIVMGVVGTNLIYARIHEFGGLAGRNHSVSIKPKYYLSRAVADNAGKIKDRFEKLLRVKKLIV